ncbi:MAG: hypothetical protein IKZ28_02300 [Clostridia bacterium]|nr:hypothetical protein [Clostridia bacterium]
MENFWDFSVWGNLNVIGVLLLTLLFANALKRTVSVLRKSLVPTSVLGGLILLVVSGIYSAITKRQLFNEPFFGGEGMSFMEVVTYHALALGFIASSLKSSEKKMTKKRATEVFNTGVTTVSTYLLQGVLGLGITIAAAFVMDGFFEAAGLLLPFGFGQGTGQALNYGTIYQTEYGFIGGRSFGLTIAALGFLSASLGGVIHLAILKKTRKVKPLFDEDGVITSEQIQSKDEIAVNGGLDKLTVQIGLVAVCYVLTFGLMYLLGTAFPGMRSVVFGFNFLIGVLMASLLKVVLNFLRKKKIVKKQYTNNFLLDRISNTCFDLMVVAGIAAIRLDVVKEYWVIMIILALVGLVVTYTYNYFVAKTLFKEYQEEQFLAMYGMLTGTASTGIVLLREIDGEFKTPAADNLVYQNFPAIVFGFPIMFLATFAPKEPLLTLGILFVFFIVMNLLLFRSKIFKSKKKEVEVIAETEKE